MATKYFILSRPLHKPANDKTRDEIITTTLDKLNFILPDNNRDYYASNGLFENNLIEWSKQFGAPDKNFLDIGAHSGTYSLCLARNFNQVYAFEPQRMTFYTLCGSVALSNLRNIQCLNFGLGSSVQSGSTELKIISADGGGSTIQPVHSDQQILAVETVEIRTLDSLQLENVGFIKMDVEGNELDVLRGGISSIKRWGRPRILFENNTSDTAIFEFLLENGYKYTRINGYSNMFLAFSAAA